MKFYWYELNLSGINGREAYRSSYYCFDSVEDHDFWAAGFKPHDTLEACIESMNTRAPNGFGTIGSIGAHFHQGKDYKLTYTGKWLWSYGQKKRPKIILPCEQRLCESVEVTKLAFERMWVEAEF